MPNDDQGLAAASVSADAAAAAAAASSGPAIPSVQPTMSSRYNERSSFQRKLNMVRFECGKTGNWPLDDSESVLFVMPKKVQPRRHLLLLLLLLRRRCRRRRRRRRRRRLLLLY